MAGWVGTFWDLKHVGVTPDLDAILAGYSCWCVSLNVWLGSDDAEVAPTGVVGGSVLQDLTM